MSAASVIVISEEARKYLRASTPSDLDADSAGKKKQRAAALAEITQRGGVVAAFELLGSGGRGFTASDIADAVVLADAETRQRCESVAERLWTEAPEQRAELLTCLPHRADWAAELARASLAKARVTSRDLLLSTLTDGALLIELTKAQGVSACIVNVVPALREKAAPILGALLEHVRFPNEEKAVSRSLACIGTLEAATIFAGHLRKKNVRPYATAFFACFPHLARPALAELAAKKTQVAEIARTILTNLDRARAVETSTMPSTRDEASGDEVPLVLREPPWMTARKEPKRRPLTVVGLEVPREPLRLRWSERARQRWVAEQWNSCGVLATEEETRAIEEKLARGEPAYLRSNHPAPILLRLLAAAPEGLHVWNETPAQAIALHGEAALGPVLERFADKLEGVLRLRIESPRFAACIARKDLLGTWSRDAALTWVERYPETAALGIIPIAVGDDEKLRPGSELALRHLAQRGHRALVERAAAHYGAEVVAAASEILASHMDQGPKKPPKMPSTYRVGELRAPLLRSGKVLPRSAVEVLDQLLAASPLHTPLACFEDIRAACEPRSLAEHVWDLAKAWDINGAKESLRWMLHAIAHFGDDEVVRRLTPALKGEGIAPMLGVIGTDAALMELVTILVRVRRAGLKKRPKYAWGTEQAIALIAARRGVDIDDLEDHFVPTFGAENEEAGPNSTGIPLDLGARTYRVTFDPQLSRVLFDDSGARVQTLPRGGKGDDPAKVQAAALVLADLEEDVSAIAELRAASLERAMIDGRTWSSADFRAVWADHALMKHMARGVVWEARKPDGASLRFRVAEDGSAADQEDEHFELGTEATIAVAHPARLSLDERKRWRALFSDYKLVQPFDQLAREAVMLTEAELASTSIVRSASADPAAIRDRLAHGGWVHSSGGTFVLPCEGSTFVVLAVQVEQESTASCVHEGRAIPFSAAGDVARAEALRALDIVAAKH